MDLGKWLFIALAMSRFAFNLRTVVPTKRFISILNDVYMRGERRLLDAFRAGPR